MNELSILFKEAEVAEFQFESTVSNLQVEDTFFTESEGSENFFTKLKDAVVNFINNIISTIKGIFQKFTSGKACAKAEKALVEDPSLKNKKVKGTDWKKVHVLNKSTQKKIAAAKSKEEVDRIMKDYKAKRNKILAATAAITLTVGAAFLFLKKGQNKTVQAMEEEKTGINYDEKASKVVENPEKIEVEKVKATADAEIRKTEVKDVSDEVKECSKIISDGVAKELMNKMNSSAIRLDNKNNRKSESVNKKK